MSSPNPQSEYGENEIGTPPQPEDCCLVAGYEAWANFWRDTDEANRKKFLALPNFDATIFLEITGINVGTKDCEGKVIEVDGKKYKLTSV